MPCSTAIRGRQLLSCGRGRGAYVSVVINQVKSVESLVAGETAQATLVIYLHARSSAPSPYLLQTPRTFPPGPRCSSAKYTLLLQVVHLRRERSQESFGSRRTRESLWRSAKRRWHRAQVLPVGEDEVESAGGEILREGRRAVRVAERREETTRAPDLVVVLLQPPFPVAILPSLSAQGGLAQVLAVSPLRLPLFPCAPSSWSARQPSRQVLLFSPSDGLDASAVPFRIYA